MKTKMKKTKEMLIILLSLVMSIGMMTVPAFAEEDETVDMPEKIYVSGVLVTEENAGDILGNGTASYDKESNVLSLNHATIEGGYAPDEESMIGIYADGDLDIVISGDNTITAPDAAGFSVGIYLHGNLEISGNGAFTVTGGTAEKECSSEKGYSCLSAGIYSLGKVSVVKYTEENSSNYLSVYADGGKAVATAAEGSEKATARSVGIMTVDGFLVKNNAGVFATGGSASGLDAYSMGMSVEQKSDFTSLYVEDSYMEAVGGKAVASSGMAYSCGIYAETSFDVDFWSYVKAQGGEANGTDAVSVGYAGYDHNAAIGYGILDLIGGTATGTESAVSAGANANNCVFSILDNKASVTCTAGTAKAPVAQANGIYLYGADLSVRGGRLTVTGGSYEGESGDASGILGLAVEDPELSAKVGAFIRIKCDEVNVNTVTYGYLNTKVKISAPNGSAIYTENEITIEGEDDVAVKSPLEIKTPKNGKATGMGEQDEFYIYEYYTIVDENGEEASDVSIDVVTYKVKIENWGQTVTVPIPSKCSLNDATCERYKVDDFSEVLKKMENGKEYQGCYTDEAFTEGNEFDFDAPITKDMTIYIKWGEKDASDENGGVGDGSDQDDSGTSGKDDLNKDDTNKDDANKDDLDNGDTDKDDANKGDTNKDDTNKGDTNKGDANKGDTNKGDNKNEDKTPAVRTGDTTKGMLWMALLLFSGAVVGLEYFRKHNQVKRG